MLRNGHCGVFIISDSKVPTLIYAYDNHGAQSGDLFYWYNNWALDSEFHGVTFLFGRYFRTWIFTQVLILM